MAISLIRASECKMLRFVVPLRQMQWWPRDPVVGAVTITLNIGESGYGI